MSLLYKYKSGGNVFPYGGPVKPYVPKSVKDHAYRKGMYEDSLSLYKAYDFQRNNWKPAYEEWLTKIAPSRHMSREQLRAQVDHDLGKPGTQTLRPFSSRLVDASYRYKSKYKQLDDPDFNYFNPSRLDQLQSQMGSGRRDLGPIFMTMPSDDVMIAKYKELIKNNYKQFKISQHPSPDLWHKLIDPIGTYRDGDLSPIYKKPVQEIADVNTIGSLPVKSVLNSPRSYPKLTVSNFDYKKKSLPKQYPMSGRQQTVLTWNPELKKHDIKLRIQEDAFIRDEEGWQDNSKPVVYYNPETKEYSDKPFVVNYKGIDQKR